VSYTCLSSAMGWFIFVESIVISSVVDPHWFHTWKTR
jgi:hypothetical protein